MLRRSFFSFLGLPALSLPANLLQSQPKQEYVQVKWDGKTLYMQDGYVFCAEDSDGKIWYDKEGKLHRDHDLPAVENVNGGKEWYQHGELHRDNDLPAIEWADGEKFWYQHGELHRDNGPAMIRINGTQEWFQHGMYIKSI